MYVPKRDSVGKTKYRHVSGRKIYYYIIIFILKKYIYKNTIIGR